MKFASSIKKIFGIKSAPMKEEEKWRSFYLVTDPELRKSLLEYVQQEINGSDVRRAFLSSGLDPALVADRIVESMENKILREQNMHELIQWNISDTIFGKYGCVSVQSPGVIVIKGDVYLSVPNPLEIEADAKGYAALFGKGYIASAQKYANAIRKWEKGAIGLQKVETPTYHKDAGIPNYVLSESLIPRYFKQVKAAMDNPAYR